MKLSLTGHGETPASLQLNSGVQATAWGASGSPSDEDHGNANRGAQEGRELAVTGSPAPSAWDAGQAGSPQESGTLKCTRRHVTWSLTARPRPSVDRNAPAFRFRAKHPDVDGLTEKHRSKNKRPAYSLRVCLLPVGRTF